MIITLKPNTLPFPGIKIYPNYQFVSNSFKIDTITRTVSQLQSWIPISRGDYKYLVSFDTSLERINETYSAESELLEDLEFHKKQIQKNYIIQDIENLTIYKYEN